MYKENGRFDLEKCNIPTTTCEKARWFKKVANYCVLSDGERIVIMCFCAVDCTNHKRLERIPSIHIPFEANKRRL